MATVRVVGGVRSPRRGKVILHPIVVCWRIVVVKAPQKRVGERHRGGGICVGCEALEGGGVLGTEHVVRRGHVCDGMPSFVHAFVRFFPRESNMREGLAPKLAKPPISSKMNGAMKGGGDTVRIGNG
jgi:hypothetical protein